MENIEIKIETRTHLKEQDTLFGIFIEDLNHALDGGLYGEMVQNRSFEYDAEDHEGYHSLTAWEAVERGDSFVQIHTESVMPRHSNNPHYLVVEALSVDKGCGVRNQGYNQGISIVKDTAYHFSCYCRVCGSNMPVMEVRLEDERGENVYAAERMQLSSEEWEKYECTLTASQSDPCGRLTLLLMDKSIIHLDMVSLFPKDTFCNRENGVRKDLGEMIADLNPAFVRFPGGCLTHVGSLNSQEKASLYRWKNTLGPVDKRQSKHNVLWQYNQTFGMGFYEFFLFCEDLQAEPIPVISAGNDPHFNRKADPEEMQEWIDEALDLIEFANGGTDTKWGGIRAEMGHPDSFRMKYLTIGNEETGEWYTRNYDIIAQAVRKRYPNIKLINSVTICSHEGHPEDGMEQAIRTKSEYTDMHVYGEPEWFFANARQFLSSPGKPRIFFGEYSSCDDTWYNALIEAAFMTEVENTDGIAFMCYAPLLNNMEYNNWHPNLIHFDNYRTFGIPSYYAQKLITRNQGEILLPTQDSIIRENKIFPRKLSGDLSMKVNLAEVEIRDFTIEKKESGLKKTVPDFCLNGQEKEKRGIEKLEEDFNVSFKFVRKEAPGTPAYRGKYALSLCLENEENGDEVTWTIDGWQRLITIGGTVGNYKTHHICEIKSGIEYRAELQVENNKASAYIDGVLCYTFEGIKAEPEELYYSAVKDKAGDVIVKVVNVLPDVKQIHIILDDKADCPVLLSSMAGHDLKERNSLEEPLKVAPEERLIQVKGGELEYRVPGYSISVFRFEQGDRKKEV